MEKFHRRIDRAEAEHITIRNFLNKIPSSTFIVRIWDYLTIKAWQLIMITVDRNKEQNTFFYVLDFNGLSSFDYFLWISFVLYKSLVRVRRASLYHKENIGGWCFKRFYSDLMRANKLITRVFCYFLLTIRIYCLQVTKHFIMIQMIPHGFWNYGSMWKDIFHCAILAQKELHVMKLFG